MDKRVCNSPIFPTVATGLFRSVVGYGEFYRLSSATYSALTCAGLFQVKHPEGDFQPEARRKDFYKSYAVGGISDLDRV